MNKKVNYFAIPGLKPVHRNSKLDVIESELIISVVCEHFKTDMEKLKSKSRLAEKVLARHLLCYFLFKYTTMNKAQIGRLLNKDHTTVIHGLQAFNTRVEMEDPVRGHVEAIKKKLFGK